MTKEQDLGRMFKALSSDARLRIVQLLKGRALCVGALSARLDVTQGAVSQHLRVLRDAGLVLPEKRGHYVHYRLNERTIAGLEKAVGHLLGKPPKKGAMPCVRRKKAARSRRT